MSVTDLMTQHDSKIHKAVQDVHDKCSAATTAAGDEITDVDLKQAEAKFR
eukprot:COSAG05_NODE_92_length_19835_cov_158.918271_14_plen_49_part_01